VLLGSPIATLVQVLERRPTPDCKGAAGVAGVRLGFAQSNPGNGAERRNPEKRGML